MRSIGDVFSLVHNAKAVSCGELARLLRMAAAR